MQRIVKHAQSLPYAQLTGSVCRTCVQAHTRPLRDRLAGGRAVCRWGCQKEDLPFTSCPPGVARHLLLTLLGRPKQAVRRRCCYMMGTLQYLVELIRRLALGGLSHRKLKCPAHH